MQLSDTSLFGGSLMDVILLNQIKERLYCNLLISENINNNNHDMFHFRNGENQIIYVSK